jgi:hypothetical protein
MEAGMIMGVEEGPETTGAEEEIGIPVGTVGGIVLGERGREITAVLGEEEEEAEVSSFLYSLLALPKSSLSQAI